MAMFSRNEDATTVPVEYASVGKRLGFLGAIEASFDRQVLAASTYGLEVALRTEEQENIQRIRKAGGVAPSSLDGNDQGPGFDTVHASKLMPTDPLANIASVLTASFRDAGPYTELIRAMHDETDVPTSGPNSRERMSPLLSGPRNAELKKLQEQFPNAGIKTYDDMFDTVKENAIAAERRAQNNPRTKLGMIGSFIGSAAGSMDPRTSPLNVATLPIGGGGSTTLARMGLQALGQGAIEAVNQYTGVREQRDILGLEQETGSAIIGAAAGGALVQGAGEAIGAAFNYGARKWFRNTPNDPAPPLPTPELSVKTAAITEPPGLEGPQLYHLSPLAASRIGTTRAMNDMASAHVELSSWDGPMPWELTPPTSSVSLPRDIDLSGGSPIKSLVEGETVDEIARRVDPDAFRAYEKLVKQRGVHGEVIDTFRRAETQANVERIDAEIANLRKQETTPEIEQQIAALEAEKNADISPIADTPDVAKARQLQSDIEARIEKLAPTIDRAYARAQNKWNVYEGQRAQIRDMMKRGDTVLPASPMGGELTPPDNFRTFADDIPEFQNVSSDAAIRPEQFKTAADYVQKVVDENKKIADEAIETYRASVAKLLKPEEGKMTLKVDGAKYELHLDQDKIAVPNESGEGFREMSVREILEDVDEGNKLLEAVSTCSVR